MKENKLTIKKINPNNYTKEEYEEITSRFNGWNRTCDLIRERNNVVETERFFIISILLAIIINFLTSLSFLVYPRIVDYFKIILITSVISIILIMFYVYRELSNNKKSLTELWKDHDYFFKYLKNKNIIKELGEKPNDYRDK